MPFPTKRSRKVLLILGLVFCVGLASSSDLRPCGPAEFNGIAVVDDLRSPPTDELRLSEIGKVDAKSKFPGFEMTGYGALRDTTGSERDACGTGESKAAATFDSALMTACFGA